SQVTVTAALRGFRRNRGSTASRRKDGAARPATTTSGVLEGRAQTEQLQAAVRATALAVRQAGDQGHYRRQPDRTNVNDSAQQAHISSVTNFTPFVKRRITSAGAPKGTWPASRRGNTSTR